MTKGELFQKLAALPDESPVMVDEGYWGHSIIYGVSTEQGSDGMLVAVIDLDHRSNLSLEGKT